MLPGSLITSSKCDYPVAGVVSHIHVHVQGDQKGCCGARATLHKAKQMSSCESQVCWGNFKHSQPCTPGCRVPAWRAVAEHDGEGRLESRGPSLSVAHLHPEDSIPIRYRALPWATTAITHWSDYSSLRSSCASLPTPMSIFCWDQQLPSNKAREPASLANQLQTFLIKSRTTKPLI